MVSLEFHDFSEENRIFRQQVKEFVLREKLLEEANAAELEGRYFSDDIITKAKQMGFFGLLVPEEYDGMGGTTTQYCILAEEISRHAFALSNIIAVHMGLASAPIIRYGSKRLKDKYLSKLATGDFVAAFAITEANAGSNIGASQTTARLEDIVVNETEGDIHAEKAGKHWILNGAKRFITNPAHADLITTMAYTGDRSKGPARDMTMFAVETAYPGFSVGEDTGLKMGLNPAQNSDIVFDNVCIPEENVIGKVGGGFKIQQETMEYGRIFLAACVLGMAREAFEKAREYAHERKILSPQKPSVLGDYQVNQVRLSKMAGFVYSMATRVYNTARIMDDGVSPDGLASLTKRMNTEDAQVVIDEAMRLHGGYGFLREFGLERLKREVWIPLIYEGTNDICDLIVYGQMRKGNLQ